MLGVHHPLLKSIRKAVQRGSRTDDGFAIAEGFHLLFEAVKSKASIGAVIATPGAAEMLDGVADLHVVDAIVFHQISSVENSQGVISLVRVDDQPVAECLHGNPLVMALDGVQDPGNAGAMVRSAEAFGASGVVFIKGSVSPWNPKALRASAGSLFRVPFAIVEWEEFLAAIQERRIALYAAGARAEKRADEVPLHEAAAILIGNEGVGVPMEHERFGTLVRIPTRSVESLNAAVAAGILLYEARRQRQ